MKGSILNYYEMMSLGSLTLSYIALLRQGIGLPKLRSSYLQLGTAVLPESFDI